MTHKSFQLHFKTLQTKCKRFEIVIFLTGVLVWSNTYELDTVLEKRSQMIGYWLVMSSHEC